MPLLIGTSGWQYRDWRPAFYPAGLPQARWLEHYATQFPAVENNGTFYRLASTQTFASWQDTTPDSFVMAVKASRYLTHVRRLRDPGQPVARLLGAAASLGSALGPVLLQLPPTLQADPPALAACLQQLSDQARQLRLAPAGGSLRVCVEVRHDSWLTAQVRQILEEHGAALCWSDRRGRPLGPLWRTASWGYLRLHEGAAQPWPHYGRRSLATWLDRIAAAYDQGSDVHVYFNNDQAGAAPADALALTRAAGQGGWPVQRPAAELTETSRRRP